MDVSQGILCVNFNSLSKCNTELRFPDLALTYKPIVYFHKIALLHYHIRSTRSTCVVVTVLDTGLHNLVVKPDERPGYHSGSDICTAPPKVRLLAEQAVRVRLI